MAKLKRKMMKTATQKTEEPLRSLMHDGISIDKILLKYFQHKWNVVLGNVNNWDNNGVVLLYLFVFILFEQ